MPTLPTDHPGPHQSPAAPVSVGQTRMIWFAIVALLLIVVAARLLPHPPNFTPVAAAALFAGFLLRNRAWTVLIPITGLLLSDLWLGAYDWRVMAVVYAALALPACAYPWLKSRPSAVTVGSTAIGAGLVFFVATNAAVWAFGTMYPHTIAGLLACFAAALPFLKFTLLGNLFYTAVFFGAWRWLVVRSGDRGVVAAS